MINYYLLTKPGIILGNLFTLAAGFLLASKGSVDIRLFLATLIGLAFIMASACVFNNYIDRQRDKKMKRTEHRVLVQGLISGRRAVLFGMVLGMIGGLILGFCTSLLALLLAGVGFFVYVVLYSLWKGRTIYGTAIGSIAGAIPPVVGYVAASHHLDAGAIILFAMLVLWQMPHFFSIALMHYEDYCAADIPVLPVKKGILRTKIHMTVYIMAFILVALLLTHYNYTGTIYLGVTFALGLLWLGFCLKGFNCLNDREWSLQMFRLSLVIIGAICLVIPFDIHN